MEEKQEEIRMLYINYNINFFIYFIFTVKYISFLYKIIIE
jgi:hypothetical protein